MDLGAFDRGYGEYLSRVQFDVKADDDVALESRIALILQMAEVLHSSVALELDRNGNIWLLLCTTLHQRRY